MTATTYADALPDTTRHHWPLAADHRDTIGGAHLTAKGKDPLTQVNGRTRNKGEGYLEAADRATFSIANTGLFTFAAFRTIGNGWVGAGPNADQYVHWAGKGQPNQYEWGGRYYVPATTGEAKDRPGRTSFYVWNLAGGQGAGSYAQPTADPIRPTYEQFVVATVNVAANRIRYYLDGDQTDQDTLSGYKITPKHGTAPLRLFTRDLASFMVGDLRRVTIDNTEWSAAQVKTLWVSRALPDVAAPAPDPAPDGDDALYAKDASDLLRAHNALADRVLGRG